MNTELNMFKAGANLGALHHDISDTSSNITQILNNRDMYQNENFVLLGDKLVLLKSAINTLNTLAEQLTVLEDLQNK